MQSHTIMCIHSVINNNVQDSLATCKFLLTLSLLQFALNLHTSSSIQTFQNVLFFQFSFIFHRIAIIPKNGTIRKIGSGDRGRQWYWSSCVSSSGQRGGSGGGNWSQPGHLHTNTNSKRLWISKSVWMKVWKIKDCFCQA